MSEQQLVLELAKRLSGKVVIGSDISDADMNGEDIEGAAAAILGFFEGKAGLKLLDKEKLKRILNKEQDVKKPVQVEIIRSATYKPLAKDIESRFKITNRKAETVTSSTSTFADYFKDRFEKLKRLLQTSSNSGMLRNISAIKQYTNSREVTVAGIIYDKIITKNGHVMVTLEDESGTTKVLFLKSDNPHGKKLFEKAKGLIYDDVIAVRGRVSSPFVIANSLTMPEIPIHQRRVADEDVAMAFISDTHFGSKFFKEKQFNTFLRWLNGDIEYKRDLAGKVKYVILSGDAADGIGVYPAQEKELDVLDIYKQYTGLFDLLQKIPDYVEVFVAPGNHDAVQAAMPQPEITHELTGELRERGMHTITNPAYIDAHGLKILSSHGTSLDNVIANIPTCSYLKPETAMVEVLRRRHLAPVYGGNIIVPSRNDPLVIDQVPDILHMGHVHKNGLAEYHGTLIVNSGTWQGKTDYQAKRGHIPTPCVVPVYEAKSMKISQIDFNNLGI